MSLLEIEGLAAGYGRLPVLTDVDLKAEEGACTCIIGPNGAGKSTVLKAIFGQLRITSGRILFAGKEITGSRPGELTALGLVYVNQGRVVFPSLSVRENLTLGVEALGRSLKTGDLEEIFGHFPRLQERLTQRAGTLSGGEQQMLAIGRALLCRPKLLLMDEPSLGLSPLLRQQLFAKIDSLRRSGMAILLVEQNARQALSVADYGYVLELGRNRYEGTGSSLLTDSRVQALYLGGHLDTPEDTEEEVNQ
jgi:branched-chain amino acid transport system ATP-binding protein